MAAVAQPIPDDADPVWKELNQTLKDLAPKLLNRDAMRRNKTQPFMTPAADKNRVYFLWDSVTRTLVWPNALYPSIHHACYCIVGQPLPVVALAVAGE